MRGMRHPLTQAIYELTDDGVLVTDGEASGIFDTRGRWRSGARLVVDASMCSWVGDGPREPVDVSTNRRFKTVIDEEKEI